MSEWKKVKLGDCCEITSSKRIFFSEYSDSGIPFYRSKEIIELSKGQSISEPLYITENRYNEIKQKFGIPQENDILLTSVGSIGIPFMVNKRDKFYFKDGNLTWLRNYKDFVFPCYIFYWLKSNEAFNILNNIALGAAQKALTIVKLKDIEVPLPSINAQHRIATILSRYDSLIENYQKQIKLLEEAAQRLYKEWFVDLHFPGHENTKIVDGVPEGWEKKPVGDLLISHMNGGWGKDSSTGSNVIQAPVIRGTDIDKIKGGVFDDLPIRFHTEKEILNKHLEVNDIILELSNGNINNVGRTLRIDDNLIKQYGKRVICASFCKFLRPIDYRISIILFSEFQDMHNGSRMQKFKKNGANGINNFDFQEFLKHEVLVPPVSFTIKELEIIQKSISDYRIQIRLLTEARDRLLPKLMSGEIII